MTSEPAWKGIAYLLMLACTSAAFPAEFATGTVVDMHGDPVAGARVGTSFTLAPTIADVKVQISYGDPPVISGTDGAFSIPAAPIGYTHVLVAAGKDGSLGFAPRQAATPTRIVLRKPARLNVKIVKGFGHRQPFAIDLMAAGSAVAYATVSGTAAEFVVPQGELELTGVGDPESIAVRQKLMLIPGHPAAVGFDLQPTSWARNLGKPAPSFTPTDVHNWTSTKEFSSPRGKWVFVTFWATWCVPCVAEMPKLIDFYEQHAAMRDRFEIIAVHSPDGTSFAAIEPAYSHLVQVWGKPIPFPLLFDSSGTTFKRWGIEAYPTNLLIDPDGRIVGAATLDDFASRLLVRQGSIWKL
jgi:thiol-disulfide isomerase/thioredoxin